MRTGKLLVAAMLSLGGVSTLGATGCVVRETRPAYYNSAPPPAQTYSAAPAEGGAYVEGSAGVQVGEPSYVYTSNLPPDPIYEDVAPAPAYGWVWIDGYWHWNGYEWTWIGGRWEAPRVGYVYIQPYYDYVGTSYVYVPGYWCDHSRLPRGVVVHDHSSAGRPAIGYHSTVAVTNNGGHVYMPGGVNATGGSTGRVYPPAGQPGHVYTPGGPTGRPGSIVVPSHMPSPNSNNFNNPGIANHGTGPVPGNGPGTIIVPSGGNTAGVDERGGRIVVPSGPGHAPPPRGNVPPPRQPYAPGRVQNNVRVNYGDPLPQRPQPGVSGGYTPRPVGVRANGEPGPRAYPPAPAPTRAAPAPQRVAPAPQRAPAPAPQRVPIPAPTSGRVHNH